MLLDRERNRRSSPATAADRRPRDDERDSEHALLCAACGHRITSDEHRIACFAAAPGCSYERPTEIATWASRFTG